MEKYGVVRDDQPEYDEAGSIPAPQPVEQDAPQRDSLDDDE
jgi:hypothetical protein